MKTGCCFGMLLFAWLAVAAAVMAIVIFGAFAALFVAASFTAAVVKATVNLAGHRSRR